MAVETNQALVELKEEALDLGIEFSANIGEATLQKRIEEKKAEIADKQKANRESKEAKRSGKKVKCIVSHKEGEDYKVKDQFFGFNGETILVEFDEEVVLSEEMQEFIKTLGYYEHYYVTEPDSDGIPQKIRKKRFKKRFLIEKVD